MTTNAVDWAAEEYSTLYLEGFRDKQKRWELSEKALKAFFLENPGIEAYAMKSGVIRVSFGSRSQMDNDAVKLFLGDELHKFQKTIRTVGLSFKAHVGTGS